MFVKKMTMVPRAATYRLSSCVMKIFYPPKVGSGDFILKVFNPKMERWFTGWLEVHAYLLSWLFGRCGLPDHPPVKCPGKCVGALFMSFLRMYTAFVVSLGALPNSILVLPRVWFLLDKFYPSFHSPVFSTYTAVSLTSLVLTISQVMRIQWRFYQRFDCLKWSWWTVPSIISGVPLYVLFLVRILVVFLVNGLRNRPVVHTANADGFAGTGPSPTPTTTTRATTPFGSTAFNSPSRNDESATTVLAMNSSYCVDLPEVEEAMVSMTALSSRSPATFHGPERSLLDSPAEAAARHRNTATF